MPRVTIPKPGLSDWVDLLGRIRADANGSPAKLGQRDRPIGERLTRLDGRPAAKLTAWVRELRDAGEDGEVGTSQHAGQRRSSGTNAAEAVRMLGWALSGAGLLLGIGATVAAFSYQPGGRINVVAVLGVLVALPNVLLLFALLKALPERVRHRLPWTRSGAVPAEHPLAAWVLRALPQQPRQTLEEAFGTTSAIAKLAAPIRRWLLLRTSQAGALAFQAGALGAALAQVIFTDLSFGWSTTLVVDVDQIHEISAVASAPWAWFWQDAVPSRALLAQTRFFRIAPEPGSAIAVYGQWWPFVAACMLFYGFLPRAVFLWVSHWRLRATLGLALVQAPGSLQVLARLESPLVLSSSAEPSPDGEPLLDSETTGRGRVPDSTLPARAVAISWGDALALCEPFGDDPWPAVRFEAGGTRTPAEDAETIAGAARESADRDLPIVLAVRGYEPPLADQVDFIAALRSAVGEHRSIIVAGVESGSDQSDESNRARLDAWRRRLQTLGDPWLTLAPVREERK